MMAGIDVQHPPESAFIFDRNQRSRWAGICTFALLRPIVDVSAQDRIRELVLQAYDEHEERSAIAANS